MDLPAHEPIGPLDLPAGPPLHLERPGRAVELLSPFVLPERHARLREVLARRTRRVVFLLDGLHDPHNVGACSRTADAFGFQDLHVVTSTGGPIRINREVSFGAHGWLTIRVHPSVEAAVDHLRAGGFRIAAADVRVDAPELRPEELPLDRPLCVAVGNERDGISASLRSAADLRARIPMPGFTESLNVSVAFGVLAHTLRQRVDALAPEDRDLSPAERVALLDRWIVRDVPRARAVLGELGRRGPG